MKKLFSFIIILFSIFSIEKINISNADFMEDLLNLETGVEELKLDFYSLENPNLKNSSDQEKFYKLDKLNKLVKQAVIKQYKNKRFWYYQTQWLITDYNYFIYYSNKYFSELKNKEIYWSTKEIESNIYKNLRNMKFHYIKFQNLARQKNMN